MDDAEAVKLHAAAGSVLVSQSEKIRPHSPDDLIRKHTEAQLLRALPLSLSQLRQLASLLTITRQQTFE